MFYLLLNDAVLIRKFTFFSNRDTPTIEALQPRSFLRTDEKIKSDK